MKNMDPSPTATRVIPPAGMYLTPVNNQYHSPTPGQITIVVTTPNEGVEAPSNALCAELKSCGFNSALMTITLSEVAGALTTCGLYGVKTG